MAEGVGTSTTCRKSLAIRYRARSHVCHVDRVFVTANRLVGNTKLALADGKILAWRSR